MNKLDDQITVNKAIKKGHWMINYPILGIMIIGFGLTIYVSTIFKNGWTSILIGFILTFCVMWLWWSVMITKWRIWAFTFCRNVHELKRRAINQGLIWRDGSIFEKTEIRSSQQKKTLKYLERKFEFQDVPEIHMDDSRLPFETQITYSKLSLTLYLAGGIGLLIIGIYKILEGDLIGLILLVMSIIAFSFFKKKKAITQPVILINENGIKTKNSSFLKWTEIKSVEVILKGRGKKSKWHLIVDFQERDNLGNWSDDIDLSDLDKPAEGIERIIKIYQQRYRQ